MFFKLSYKNVKKSFKNYTLYFLTLTFGVCIFYVFNSIEAQQAMMNISESTAQMMRVLTQLMEAVSVFISIILGFLIVYANNFLIRRRKKEIGIYMTLGMEKRKVARMLVVETLIIGILSLGTGLVTGVFLSQGLSVVTARLFEVDMTAYRFIFSPSAFLKTIIYFGVIFAIVIAVSTLSTTKFKLIELINAEKQNEKQRLRHPVLTVVLFVLSIVCLGIAYGMVLKNGIYTFDKRLLLEIVLGSVGTFLFFASLSGFFLRLLQVNRKFYLKGLNAFILRQINSRVNTAHISMSFICLMLFCTIGILSTGLGMTNVMNKSFEHSAPYDVSFRIKGEESIIEKLEEYDFNLSEYADKYVEFLLYEHPQWEVAKKEIFSEIDKYKPENAKRMNTTLPLYGLKLFDYNELMKLQGKEGIKLEPNQVAIYSEFVEFTPALKEALTVFIENKNNISILEKDYEVYPGILTAGVQTTLGSDILAALVVPDGMLEGGTVKETILSLNCKDDSTLMQRKLESELYSLIEKYRGKGEEIKIMAITRDMVKSISAGTTAVISFIGIYLGIVFLITSAAVLALQQLSEAADNRHRYNILQKIGADERLINSALFRQIAIYFVLPLALAGIHSIVGIKVANDVIRDAGRINALGNIAITAALIGLIYCSYFLATYFSSKRIILRD
jgi:putative ABC transport system permease protein